MRNLWRDTRYALRSLSANRLFAASIILSLGLAIGVTTAVFSFTDAVLLRPLPWRDANRIVMMWGSKTTEIKRGISGPDLDDLRAQNRCFADVVPFLPSGNSTSASDGENVNEFEAGTAFFSVLGVQPYLGRPFRPEDSEPGNSHVAVISYSFWKARFGGDPKAIGRTLTVSGEPYTVIGVAPPNFFFPDEKTQAWVPIPHEMLSGARGGPVVHALARLKPGVTLAEAQSQVDTIVSRLKSAYPAADKQLVMGLFPLADQILGSYRAAIWSLFGGVLLLLLIACANVAHLLLARAMRRGPEISVRVALGATRGDILRQLLTESLVLAAGGGIVGILIAYWGMRLLLLEHLADIPRFREAGINGTALLFALGISLVSGLLFGLLPALHA
ncbi:MAG TPA: ABC transporter permease, partial [Candidatus Acidoferrales bacterium]|nr:ABC transporter permease [Candidatus Acidoferrales bacterium]